MLRSYSFTPCALIWPESLSVCPTSRITMMSFLALNMQVAKASVTMHEMPIATAAKEVAIRQATAFFWQDVCIGRARPSARALGSHHRLSAAANRRRTDRTEISICCTVMSPVLARSRHVETSRASPISEHKRTSHERRDRVDLTKILIAVCAILVSLIGGADAEQCPPGALGASRTLVVDPTEHPRVGSMQYPETLPLDDHEVVLTFDDGPIPRYTTPILETLASECVKATFSWSGKWHAPIRRWCGAFMTRATLSPTTPKTTPFAKCRRIRRRARSKGVLSRCAMPSGTRRRCRLSFGTRVCCARSRSSSTSMPMAI